MRNKEKAYTSEEYFELELSLEERREYVNSEIKLITSGTPNHNSILANLLVAFKLSLKHKSDETFALNQRL